MEKTELKNSILNEPEGENAEANLDKAIDYIRNPENRETVKEVAEEINKSESEDSKAVEEKKPDFVFEITEEEADGETKKVFSVEDGTDSETKKETKDTTAADKSKEKEEDTTSAVTDETVFQKLREKNPELYRDVNSLDELEEKLKSTSDKAAEANYIKERNEHVKTALTERMKNDDAKDGLNDLMKAAGIDKLPNSTKEAWEEWAKENPYYANKIERRIQDIAVEEATLFEKAANYSKTAEKKNFDTAEKFGKDLDTYVTDLLNPKKDKNFSVREEDIKPIREEALKFLNGGNLPDKYFDIVRVGKKEVAVLNGERLFADFIYSRKDVISKYVSQGLTATKSAEIRDHNKKVKDKAANADLASVTTSGTKNKSYINPANREEYEHLGADAIDKMIDGYRARKLNK